MGAHTDRHPRPSRQASGDHPVQPPRRTCGEIHVQAKRKDHGEECAGHRYGEDSPAGCPAARRATADVRRVCWQATKYPGKGVLHDFARCDKDFRRE